VIAFLRPRNVLVSRCRALRRFDHEQTILSRDATISLLQESERACEIDHRDSREQKFIRAYKTGNNISARR